MSACNGCMLNCEYTESRKSANSLPRHAIARRHARCLCAATGTVAPPLPHGRKLVASTARANRCASIGVSGTQPRRTACPATPSLADTLAASARPTKWGLGFVVSFLLTFIGSRRCRHRAHVTSAAHCRYRFAHRSSRSGSTVSEAILSSSTGPHDGALSIAVVNHGQLLAAGHLPFF